MEKTTSTKVPFYLKQTTVTTKYLYCNLEEGISDQTDQAEATRRCTISTRCRVICQTARVQIHCHLSKPQMNHMSAGSCKTHHECNDLMAPTCTLEATPKAYPSSEYRVCYIPNRTGLTLHLYTTDTKSTKLLGASPSNKMIVCH